MNEICTLEKEDCFIRSMCALWGRPYDYCRCIAHRHGFNGGGMPFAGIVELLGPQEEGCFELVKTWALAHRQGRFLVEVNRHALSVIDGIVEDLVYIEHPVLGYWEIT